MFRAILVIAIAACGSSPAPRSAQPEVAVVPPDAAPDAAPDAGIPDEVANAPAWIFRYHAADRLETWTLRWSGDRALVVVETARGTTRYLGTAADAKTLTLAVSTSTAKLTLECKREKLAVAAKCGGKPGPKLDVLDCYHPDFKAPMSFAAAPGIEFVTVDGCNGYRLLVP